MARLLKGAEVTAALNAQLQSRVQCLQALGRTPTLAIVRVGQREDDLSYEKGALKRCQSLGVAVRQFLQPENATQADLLRVIDQINRDKTIHGCLLFRPLPPQFDDVAVRAALDPAKDSDGITDVSLLGVFANTGAGFAPCTAQAVMEMLDHYGVELQGARVTVIGRSLVVGKPLSLLLQARHATVTMCHSRTRDLAACCRQAEILIAAAGQAQMVDASFLTPGQTVIDVGVNFTAAGKLVGDVDFAAAEPIVAALSPVPGGVGAVTTTVLVKHVIQACEAQTE